MKFEFTVLASHSGSPSKQINQSAYLLNVREEYILIDCGEGTQQQLMNSGHSYMKINHVLISHLHADHYTGIIGLLNTWNLSSRKKDVHLYCPEGLNHIIDVNFKYSGVETGFRIIYHFLKEDTDFEKIAETDFFTIHSIKLQHRVPCFGFYIQEKPNLLKINKKAVAGKNLPFEALRMFQKGLDFISDQGVCHKFSDYTNQPLPSRSLCFLTDTLPDEKIHQFIKNTDILFHEATFTNKEISNAEVGMHSTARQAAEFACRVNPGKLVIGHLSTRYKKTEEHLAEAKAIFTETYIAEEGMRFEIPYRR